MSSNSTPTPDERDRNKSALDLDTQIMNDNLAAAINAAEKIHYAARKKLVEQGLAPAASSGGNGSTVRLGDLLAQIGNVKVTAPAAKSRGLSELSDLELRALAKPIVQFVRQTVSEAVTPLIARLAELEGRPTMKYHGVWSEREPYSAGAVVTHKGALWYCWDGNVGVRPGGSNCWQLCVQKGRDARDSR